MATVGASSLVPQLENKAGPEPAFEQPRDFHFAVTWASLFTHLDLIESSGPYLPRESRPTLAVVPVTTAPAAIPQQTEDDEIDAAWEMVVPKMIRTAARTFVKPQSTEAN